ncbi:unnamed protein product [Anisakis simplex]|uniref:Zinc transporter ZIP2 (inferred by orthology to a human protein) n=1 Tax=Anisakis simplex TaxID=6269 RepID=A0A158PP76_ANISI|nr:unnamed protein product [Anisakis simplex]
MDVLVLKIALLIAMAVISFCFGLLPIKINNFVDKRQRIGNGGYASLALSMLSCLSGGVFLGVCLLDLMPFASETYEVAKSRLGWSTDYPFVPLIIGLGFFFVYLIEEISLKIYEYETSRIALLSSRSATNKDNGDNHSDNDSNNNANKISRSTLRTSISIDDCAECKECEVARSMELRLGLRHGKAIIQPVGIELQHAQREPTMRHRGTSLVQAARVAVDVGRVGSAPELVKSITFVTAFTFHSCLEGFVFGVQDSTLSLATLFFGIIVHKAVVLFSIGLRLVRSHPARTYTVILLVALVSLTSPLGAAVGMAVRVSDLRDFQSDTYYFYQSLLFTTIIYTCYLLLLFKKFQILFTEVTTNDSKLLQWLSTAVGFIVIALLMMFE